MRARSWSGILLAMATAGTSMASLASSPAFPQFDLQEATAEWSKVEAIRALAERIDPTSVHGRYESTMGSLHLAPDGRFVTGFASAEQGMPRSAGFGTFRIDGDWLELTHTGGALDPSSIDDAMLQRMQADYERFAAEQAAEGGDAAAETAEEDEEDALDIHEVPYEDDEAVDATADAEMQEMFRRWLIVPFQGGHLLLPGYSLRYATSGWDGKGPLRLQPSHWKVAVAPADPENPAFELEDPLHPAVPWELRRKLQRVPLELRVVERLQDEDTLVWKAHEAKLQLRLDRGELHGVYKNMDLYGTGPDQRLFAVVTEVHPTESIAVIELSRFSPLDRPMLPGPGVRFISRRGEVGCGIDASAAVRAKVLASEPVPDATEEWTHGGFEWRLLGIDHGSDSGLEIGDRLRVEDPSHSGDGRVASLAPNRATVLWRARSYFKGHTPTLPPVGSAVVTSSWESVANELFGSRSVPGTQ